MICRLPGMRIAKRTVALGAAAFGDVGNKFSKEGKTIDWRIETNGGF